MRHKLIPNRNAVIKLQRGAKVSGYANDLWNDVKDVNQWAAKSISGTTGINRAINRSSGYGNLSLRLALENTPVMRIVRGWQDVYGSDRAFSRTPADGSGGQTTAQIAAASPNAPSGLIEGPILENKQLEPGTQLGTGWPKKDVVDPNSGAIDSNTENAGKSSEAAVEDAKIRRWQEMNGVTVDGKWGPKSRARAAEVKSEQEKLRAAGYDIAVDGLNGPNTRAAAADYAKKQIETEGLEKINEGANVMEAEDAVQQRQDELDEFDRTLPDIVPKTDKAIKTDARLDRRDSRKVKRQTRRDDRRNTRQAKREDKKYRRGLIQNPLMFKDGGEAPKKRELLVKR